IIHEVADDQVRPSGAAIDNPTGQYAGGAVPLHVHGAAAIAFRGPHFGPPRRSSRFLFLNNGELMPDQAPVVGDRLAQASSASANHLDDCLHAVPPALKVYACPNASWQEARL